MYNSYNNIRPIVIILWRENTERDAHTDLISMAYSLVTPHLTEVAWKCGIYLRALGINQKWTEIL